MEISRTAKGRANVYSSIWRGIASNNLTLWLQSAGTAALIAWVRRALAGDMQQIGALRSAALIVRLTAAVVVLHGMEILLWAMLLSLAVPMEWRPEH